MLKFTPKLINEIRFRIECKRAALALSCGFPDTAFWIYARAVRFLYLAPNNPNCMPCSNAGKYCSCSEKTIRTIKACADAIAEMEATA